MQFPRTQNGLIYCDPAWEHLAYSDKGLTKSPQMHYECMSLDEMKAMRDDILFASAPDCVCIMWTLWNFMDQAIDLMTTWGFEYKTGGVWNKVTKNGKQSFGTGYILRGSSEPFIIGTLGNPKIKNRSTRNSLFTGDIPDNLHDLANITINSLLREHSRKPPEMYEIIENLFEGDYLELFARTQRPGWNFWGNETTKFKEAC